MIRSSVRNARQWLAGRIAPSDVAGTSLPPKSIATPSDQRSEAYRRPGIDDVDLESNVEWNRRRWGQAAGWSDLDQFGYSWGSGHQQTVGATSRLADTHLRPHLKGRYDCRILELSPGGGRFTAELVRYASEMVLVDLNAACLDVCAERFRFVPTEFEMHSNDGKSLEMVNGPFDVIACFDSMVHMHPDVITQYVEQMSKLVAPDGFIWLDHSGKGERKSGHRTAMTAEWMSRLAVDNGLEVQQQTFRNDWDCISVLRPRGSSEPELS